MDPSRTNWSRRVVERAGIETQRSISFILSCYEKREVQNLTWHRQQWKIFLKQIAKCFGERAQIVFLPDFMPSDESLIPFLESYSLKKGLSITNLVPSLFEDQNKNPEKSFFGRNFCSLSDYISL